MNSKITTKEVVQQFARSIQLLLEWVDQREDGITEDISKLKIDDFGKHELLNAAEAAKILKIGKSKMYQMMQRGEIPTVHFGRSVRVRVVDLEEFIDGNVM